MIHEASFAAAAVFAAFVLGVLAFSFYLGSKAKSAQGFFAAHGEIPWFVNGVAFAGDYLSAASFLGICGMIAFYGYDGFLYSIGYLAGWIVALLVVAEPLKHLGKFTFADALDAKFQSRGVKLAAAISTLVVSLFYLIPQMVGAGTLVQPLLGLTHWQGVLAVGCVVVMIVVTAGMVSTTWVQFIKGAMLVVFCTLLTLMILQRGLSTTTDDKPANFAPTVPQTIEQLRASSTLEEIAAEGAWIDQPYVRFRERESGRMLLYRQISLPSNDEAANVDLYAQAQYLQVIDDKKFVGGLPQGKGEGQADLQLIGQVIRLPGEVNKTGWIGPLNFFATIDQSDVVVYRSHEVADSSGKMTIYYPLVLRGSDLLTPGSSPTFASVRSDRLADKLDFWSLMLALFCGTASLPHILIRYYTVKDQASARKSTVVGIATIGFFYILTLYLGLGAMTGGTVDPSNNNMTAPLLARSFGELPFAVISAIAFTTVLGTVSGLILAASGAVAHDLMTSVLQMKLTDDQKVKAGKTAAIVVGVLAMALGIVFERFNVTFLVGWAFNVAASANLPALVMLLFWKRTTREGITAAVLVGMFSSLGWILLSQQAFKDIYRLPVEQAWAPFSQPAIVTIPLGFAVLVVVSLLTQRPAESKLKF